MHMLVNNICQMRSEKKSKSKNENKSRSKKRRSSRRCRATKKEGKICDHVKPKFVGGSNANSYARICEIVAQLDNMHGWNWATTNLESGTVFYRNQTIMSVNCDQLWHLYKTISNMNDFNEIMCAHLLHTRPKIIYNGDVRTCELMEISRKMQDIGLFDKSGKNTYDTTFDTINNVNHNFVLLSRIASLF